MKNLVISKNLIENKILLLRGERIMVDRDLAELYGVSVKRLNEQVKRNIARFPGDFVFKLVKVEFKELVANCDRFKKLKHSSVMPNAFTEQGVAMLSSVLSSDRAVKVNIAIMRTFVLMRKLSFSYEILERRLSAIEKKQWKNDEATKEILETIKCLISGGANNKSKVIKGFEG